MKKLYVLSLLMLQTWLMTAQVKDSLSTVYRKGEFVSYYHTATAASEQVVNGAVDEFIDQFRGDPEALFEWAMKGLGVQNDQEKDEVVLVIKEALYDKTTGIGSIMTDVVVPGFRTYKDVAIQSKVTKERLENGVTRVKVDIYYSNALLKKAYGTFFVIPQGKNKSVVAMRIHVRFGWFFDIFITQKRYRNIVEWRMKGFVDNFKAESERRARVDNQKN